MRQLNARMWGRSRTDAGIVDRSSSDPVKLGGCGRICEGGSWVPVYDHGGRWSPGSLATCDSALLCDYCGPRQQATSAARWRWHFEDWLGSGGELVHLRVSFAHTRGDDLAPMLADLQRAFERLRRSAAWRDAGFVDWVRVLHIRWSPATGWYPHYHVVGFVRIGHTVPGRMAEELQAAWRDRVSRSVGRGVARRHGLFARVITSSWRALYAWHWADEDDDEADGELAVERDAERLDYPDGWADDGHNDDGRSWPLYRLAEAALDGDRVAWAAWAELCRAVKGVPVVRCSKMLATVWREHEAELPAPEPEPLGEPVAQVHAHVWELARRNGLTELGLELGRTHGIEALAQWWASELGVVLELADGLCPRLSARDGPAPALSLN